MAENRIVEAGVANKAHWTNQFSKEYDFLKGLADLENA